MDSAEYFTLLACFDSIRLDDCECALDCHEKFLQMIWSRYRAEAGNYKIGKNLGPEGLSYSLFQGGGESAAEVRGSFDRADSGGGHRGVFVFGSALPAADDGAGVAHPATRRRRLPGDEADDGLLHIGLNPFGGALFRVAADFADQNDGVGVRIIVEKLDGIEKRSADDGIAADADAGGLADAELRQLMDGLIGERAAAADDADVSLLVNAAGHDADFAFARRDDARAVRPDEPRFLEVHDARDTHHVQSGNAFRDAHGEWELGVGRF